MRHHVVLRVIAKLLIPFIVMFALYVQFHGDFSPGGGFQAGVIMAAGFILYGIVFGLENARKVASMPLVRALVALGVLIYAGVGIACMFGGGAFLNYSVLAADAVHGQELGIGLIEFGVGVTVASVMITIFYCFAGRGR